ncbi:MAG: hypothetical protein KDK76_03925 [Chlamydiia bacterium]|nr:hypothetical protein [Chlamydiia bacterium]
MSLFSYNSDFSVQNQQKIATLFEPTEGALKAEQQEALDIIQIMSNHSGKIQVLDVEWFKKSLDRMSSQYPDISNEVQALASKILPLLTYSDAVETVLDTLPQRHKDRMRSDVETLIKLWNENELHPSLIEQLCEILQFLPENELSLNILPPYNVTTLSFVLKQVEHSQRTSVLTLALKLARAFKTEYEESNPISKNSFFRDLLEAVSKVPIDKREEFVDLYILLFEETPLHSVDFIICGWISDRSHQQEELKKLAPTVKELVKDSASNRIKVLEGLLACSGEKREALIACLQKVRPEDKGLIARIAPRFSTELIRQLEASYLSGNLLDYMVSDEVIKQLGEPFQTTLKGIERKEERQQLCMRLIQEIDKTSSLLLSGYYLIRESMTFKERLVIFERFNYSYSSSFKDPDFFNKARPILEKVTNDQKLLSMISYLSEVPVEHLEMFVSSFNKDFNTTLVQSPKLMEAMYGERFTESFYRFVENCKNDQLRAKFFKEAVRFRWDDEIDKFCAFSKTLPSIIDDIELQALILEKSDASLDIIGKDILKKDDNLYSLFRPLLQGEPASQATIEKIKIHLFNRRKSDFKDYVVYHHDVLDALVKLFANDKESLHRLLDIAIEANFEPAVAHLLLATTLSTEEIKAHQKTILQNHNLSLLRVMFPKNWKEIAFDHCNVEKEELQKMVLNSKTSDFEEFLAFAIEKKPSLAETKVYFDRFIQEGLPLIARFSDPIHQSHVYQIYGKDYTSYEEQQFTFGNKRHQKLTEARQMLKDNPQTSLDQIFNHFNPEDRKINYSATPIGARYGRFFHLANRMIEEENCNPNNPTSIVWLENSQFRDYPMHWFHALKNEEEAKFLDGMEKEFTFLVNFPLNKADPQSIQEFKSRLASFYWKGVQSMVTARGNSQTMLELHQLLHLVHGLTPPVISRNWVLPDCVALSMDHDLFVNKYYNECWE